MSQKFALIIGCSEFTDSALAQLLTPDADTQELAGVLRDPAIGAFDQVDLLVNEPAAIVQRAIARFFRQRQRDDLLLLYFSGHGVLDFSGRLYLAFKDTERELLSGTAIPAEFITKEMDGTDSRRVVLILDCCHSGAFARGTKGVVGASVGTAAAFEGSGHGHVVLTASDATQYAWEGEQVTGQPQFSLFTRHLIEGLRMGVADANGDGWITVDELFDYAHRQVVNQTPNQRPFRWNYRQQGEIVLARNRHLPAPKVEARALPAEIQELIADARPLVRKSAVGELSSLLRRQTPEYEAAALAALRQLADPASEDSNQTLAAAKQALATWEAERLAPKQKALDELLGQADADCQAGRRPAAIALYEQAARMSEGEPPLAAWAKRAQTGIAQCRVEEAAHEQKQVEQHASEQAEAKRKQAANKQATAGSTQGRTSPALLPEQIPQPHLLPTAAAPKARSLPVGRMAVGGSVLVAACICLSAVYALWPRGVVSYTPDPGLYGAAATASAPRSGATATAGPRATTVALPTASPSILRTAPAVSPSTRELVVGVVASTPRKLTDLSVFMADALFNTLLSSSLSGGTRFDLATSVSISPDKTTLTYKLRPGVTWHDGTPFTASDVVNTINYWNDQQRKGNAVLFSRCSGAVCGWPSIASANTIDNLTLVVKFSAAGRIGDETALESLYVLPAAFWRNRNPDAILETDLVGTGPLMLVDWTGEESTFIANQKYYNGAPTIQQLRLLYLADDSAVRAAFAAGTIDVGLAANGTVFASSVKGIQAPKYIGDSWAVNQWQYK